MLRLILISMVMVSLIGMISCSSDPVSSIDGENATIYFNQSVTFGPEKIKIGFDSLLNESRCPNNALILCFWQGMAEIRLWLLKPGMDTVFIAVAIEGLTQYPEDDSYPAVDTLGLSIELIGLNPYPNDPENMAPQYEYIATLKIEESNCANSADGIIRIVDIAPSSLFLDEYNLTGAEISGDLLNLTVQYGGGCKKHYFFAYMSPDSFLESEPVQANIYLQHYANNDMCEALITDELQFDLTPVKELYRELYLPGGEIILNVYDYYEDTPGEKISVSYYIPYPPD